MGKIYLNKKIGEMKMENVVNELNVYLSDLNVFYRKLQNYHWNIKGPLFFVFHATFSNNMNIHIPLGPPRCLRIVLA